MSYSSKLPSELDVRSIKFFNGSYLGDDNNLTGNLNIRKRLRVESDLTVNGKIPYVDNQTGWGLSQWTFASSSYNKETDSLISKIKVIQDTYATKQYVDNLVFGNAFPGLTYYETATYPKYDTPSATYPTPITTLAANTGFILRDSNDTTMNFYFQKGSVQVGKVLGCLDTDGKVGWVNPSNTATQSDTIQSTNGQSNSFTFRVIDVGTSGNSSTKGFYFYPNIANNSFNKSLLASDFALLGGIYQQPTSSNLRMFIGPTSYGYEGISFVSTYQTLVNSVMTTFPGKTTISGSDSTQKITLDSTGIIINPSPNLTPLVQIPHVTKNLSTNTWRKPFTVKTVSPQDEYPTFITMKTDSTNPNINRAVMINPYLFGTNFNNLVKSGDIGIISADISDFFYDGNSSEYNEVDYGFVIAPWSRYYDGIRIRPTLQIEETTIPLPMTSGYTRLSAKNQQTYLEVNRNGIISCLDSSLSSFSHYGPFKILNKIGALLNNTNTATVYSSFQVGTDSSLVTSSFYGNTSIGYGDLFLQPTGSPATNGYFLQCTSSNGQAQWSPLPNFYNNFTANFLSGRQIVLSYGEGTVASLSIQNTSIFQGVNDRYLHVDNNYNADINGGEIVFTVRDNQNIQYYPLFINKNGIYLSLNKSITFGDNSVQSSAYTGAKGLAGSYTSANITIDSQGKITAISSNSSTSVPSTINTPITFTGGATFNTSTTTFNSPVIAYNTVDVAEKLSFNDFNAVNIMQSVNTNADGLGFSRYNDTISEQISVGWVPGGTDPQLNGNVSYPNETWLYAWNAPVTIGRMYIPANYNNRISFNIPIQITNKWAFQGDADAGQPNGNYPNDGCAFKYILEKIRIQFIYLDEIYSDYTYTNTSPFISSDLGAFEVNYKRLYHSNSNIYNGPNNDRHVLTHSFTMANPSFQCSFPKETSNRQYDISVQCFWSFRYNSYGGHENNIKNHWGTDVSSHYFLPWSIRFLQSTPSTWSASQTNYTPDIPIETTQYSQYYEGFLWKKPFLPDSNSFSWGVYYGQLSWGQLSLLNTDQIFTHKKVLIGNGQFGNLYVNGEIQSLGIINCRGYMGRPGLGSSISNPNIGYTDMFQTNTLANTSIFNNYWNGVKVETWVDFTLLLSQSPNVSDYRIKSNFKEIPRVLDDICKTPIYQFDVNFDSYHVTSKTGVIAHEIQENFSSFPHLVSGEKDAVNSEGKIAAQSIDYQELTIILMKGIQELKEENEQMKLQIQELFTLVQSLLQH